MGCAFAGVRIPPSSSWSDIQKEAQLDQFLAMMQFWSIPHEKTMHSIELFGKYVIPHFQERKGMQAEEGRPNP